MKKVVLLAGLVLLVTLATAAYSAPTLQGPTGIVNVPTTDIVAAGTIEAQLSYDKVKPAGVEVKTFPILTVGYGLEKGEVGLTYQKVKDGDSIKGLHGKYVFVPESEQSPGIAGGLVYLKDGGKLTELYVTASKRLAMGEAAGSTRASLGVIYQKLDVGVSQSKTRPMIGLEYTAAGGTYIGADYILKSGNWDSTFGVVVRHAFTPVLTGQIGAGKNSEIFLGVIYKMASGT